MPDILIRGMKMPKTCAICKIRSCNSYCPLNIEIKFFFDPSNTGFDFCTGRHSDCPLIELPEHGNLIDGDAVLNKIDAYVCGSQDSEFIKNEIIKAMPVIVPASEEVTNDPKP